MVLNPRVKKRLVKRENQRDPVYRNYTGLILVDFYFLLYYIAHYRESIVSRWLAKDQKMLTLVPEVQCSNLVPKWQFYSLVICTCYVLGAQKCSRQFRTKFS
uniref:Uncharacterized protein n=1 Tax=Cacopsylla melanoneura TaxID=428564 RepID=A0A8D8Y9M4_9HEMI